jgi:hypothetical protein
VIGEFTCPGFDNYALTKLVGGVNKGRPNEEDLKEVEEFAKGLVTKINQ